MLEDEVTDITTPEGRAELRRHLKLCDTLERDLGHMDDLDRALDGLDIAQEMAEHLHVQLRGFPPTADTLAKWDKWLDIYGSAPPS